MQRKKMKCPKTKLIIHTQTSNTTVGNAGYNKKGIQLVFIIQCQTPNRVASSKLAVLTIHAPNLSTNEIKWTRKTSSICNIFQNTVLSQHKEFITIVRAVTASWKNTKQIIQHILSWLLFTQLQLLQLKGSKGIARQPKSTRLREGI